VAGSVATLAMPALADETLSSGVTYKVIKSGPADGPKPEVGELVAIRFKAFAGDLKIDDLFDSPEPYYTRVGSGGLIKGVEQTLPLMKLGDRWEMTIPVGERQQKYCPSPVATFCKLLTFMSCF
jgi:FKBP-type peptidyl-prolyl cis-trans isomerase